MAAHGIRNQIDGWRGLGDDKRADYLARKHAYLVANYAENVATDDISTIRPDGTPMELRQTLLTVNDRGYRDLLERFGNCATEKAWQEGSFMWVS
jgi:hypothetical protein